MIRLFKKNSALKVYRFNKSLKEAFEQVSVLQKAGSKKITLTDFLKTL